MARRFAKVSEEEIKTAFFYPSDLVNTKTTIPLRVGEERWIYTSTLRVSVYIHHYSPPLRGIVVYYPASHQPCWATLRPTAITWKMIRPLLAVDSNSVNSLTFNYFQKTFSFFFSWRNNLSELIHSTCN